MATGVAPRGELAAGAGLELDERRDPGRRVDAHRASRHARRRRRRVRRERVCRAAGCGWSTGATRSAQGEIAGRTAAGETAQWDAVPGFWSTIGSHTLKYAAWGDGYDESRLEPHGDGAFTAWYGRDGRIVGVLAHEADEDYERGRSLIAEGAPWR